MARCCFFAQCPFDKVLGASNLAMLRYEWIWYKERGTGFLNANRAPLKKSENILVFYQKSPAYFPQFELRASRIPEFIPEAVQAPTMENLNGQGIGVQRWAPLSRECTCLCPRCHPPCIPTQKPVELCEYLIRTYTRPGELVADICAGSGTTADGSHEHRPPLCML